ncbi:MAG: potassium-transporting ATPase subunit KdpC [Lentisphaerota bacterium]
MKIVLQAICLFLLMMILTGVIYPLVITGISKGIFSYKANGSLLEKDGKITGSELIAQKFDSNSYFWSRPSATDFQTLPSCASNAGPTSKALRETIKARADFLLKESSLPSSADVPEDLLFASGSGLDPHISPEAALFQMKRVAKYRNYDDTMRGELDMMVQNSIEYPQFGFLGEPRVNVLLLNISLDNIK